MWQSQVSGPESEREDANRDDRRRHTQSIVGPRWLCSIEDKWQIYIPFSFSFPFSFPSLLKTERGTKEEKEEKKIRNRIESEEGGGAIPLSLPLAILKDHNFIS